MVWWFDYIQLRHSEGVNVPFSMTRVRPLLRSAVFFIVVAQIRWPLHSVAWYTLMAAVSRSLLEVAPPLRRFIDFLMEHSRYWLSFGSGWSRVESGRVHCQPIGPSIRAGMIYTSLLVYRSNFLLFYGGFLSSAFPPIF
ncbi:hypothetical protein CRG98_046823 [Punica granatum]|uniref:Uncharacterized protein n=1 Tax=Punica granatum TaxID=22663 RepID=A0A2I0HM37_PUNGR|nr:hypothetical protein CRG98_046823 [Punica granatum]